MCSTMPAVTKQRDGKIMFLKVWRETARLLKNGVSFAEQWKQHQRSFLRTSAAASSLHGRPCQSLVHIWSSQLRLPLSLKDYHRVRVWSLVTRCLAYAMLWKHTCHVSVVLKMTATMIPNALCSPVWPQIHDPPASIPWLLGYRHMPLCPPKNSAF